MRYLGGRINFLGDSFSRVLKIGIRDEAQERLLAISANPKQVLGLFNAAEFHDEMLGFEPLPEAEWKEGAGALQRVIRVLFVPTYEFQDAEDRLRELGKKMTLEDGNLQIRFHVAEPSQADDENVGFWVCARGQTEQSRKRLLSLQAHAAGITLLRKVVEIRPRILVALGQGCLPVLVADQPELRHQSYQSRVISEDERREMDTAWANLREVHLVDPHLGARPQRFLELSEALPIFRAQRNAIVKVWQDRRRGSYEETELVAELYRAA